jgi:hypothetical protein
MGTVWRGQEALSNEVLKECGDILLGLLAAHERCHLQHRNQSSGPMPASNPQCWWNSLVISLRQESMLQAILPIRNQLRAVHSKKRTVPSSSIKRITNPQTEQGGWNGTNCASSATHRLALLLSAPCSDPISSEPTGAVSALSALLATRSRA